MENLCAEQMGTALKEIRSTPNRKGGFMIYPSLVEGLCYDPITFANKLVLEREQAIAERDAAAAEATRLREKKRNAGRNT